MRPFLLAVCALPVLLSCASDPDHQADDVVDRIIAEDAARAAAAQPLGNSYPSLRDVPPRPELGYTVEQRREIKEGLVADMAYAERTSALVRTTEGAAPLPPPKSPEIVAGNRTPVAQSAQARQPTSKVLLVERRDTSGDLASFLDGMVGLEAGIDVVVDPSTVPSPASDLPAKPGSDTSSDQSMLAPTEAAPAPSGSEPGFFAALGSVFGGSSDQEAGPASADPPVATAAASAAVPLEVDRTWLFPLTADAPAPTDQALAPMLDAVSRQGALAGRRLLVVGRAGSPDQAVRRADSVAAELVAKGVPADRIDSRPDTATPGEVVTVTVLSAGA